MSSDSQLHSILHSASIAVNNVKETFCLYV